MPVYNHDRKLACAQHITPYRDCARRLGVTLPPLPRLRLPSHFEFAISRLETDTDYGKAVPDIRSFKLPPTTAIKRHLGNTASFDRITMSFERRQGN
jgi:hypothetical protein